MHKLKITFVSCGTFTHVGPYLEFFRDRGHDVSWIVYARANKDYGVPTYDISGGASGQKTSSKWKYLVAGLTIRKVLKKISPDVVHGHYATSAGTICLMSGFRPYIISVRGSDLINSMGSFIWKKMLRLIFKRASLVHTVSGQLADLAKTLGVPDKRLFALTQGIDTKAFDYQPKQTLSSPIRLICTRVLGKVYDPVTIINACEILKQRGVPFKLTLAAGGPLQHELEALAAGKGLADYILFMGGYDNTTLPQLLHDHDVYVSASLWDGTSISLLEAMACGIFPLVSRIASNQAWLDDGKTALMFECSDPQELAEQIIRVSSDNQLHRNAAQINRDLVEQKADRTTNMLRLEEWYYRILNN